jgi:hypothetical protein
MAVDDYPSGSNARRHQNKLGTAISSIAGPADRAGAQPIRGSEARPAGSFLVDLRCLRFCQSYIGCPEHFNPLQQFVLLRNVLGGSYSRQLRGYLTRINRQVTVAAVIGYCIVPRTGDCKPVSQ